MFDPDDPALQPAVVRPNLVGSGPTLPVSGTIRAATTVVVKATETPGTPTTLAKSISRIEALCVLHFIALLVHALIEREVRATMATGAIPELPLYPEDRACKAPSAARILEIFSSSSVATCSTRPGA